MDSLILRALKHPIDYCGVAEIHDLEFVEHLDLGHNTHSFEFKKPISCTWKPGQHAIFMIPGKKVKNKKQRAFSVASSPDENRILIATTLPPEPSDFKQKLLKLMPGEKVRMFGPYGEFHAKKANDTMIGVAGGIGITPFRALLKNLSTLPEGTFTFELIYGGKDNFFAFREEFEKFAQHPNITIHFVNTPEEINQLLEQAVAKHHNKASYFISGSPGMIQALYKKLRENKITHIINDPFKGY